MKLNKVKLSFPEDVIFAPEGFLDRRYLPALRNNDVRIIEIRTLSDGPVFQMLHRHSIDFVSKIREKDEV